MNKLISCLALSLMVPSVQAATIQLASTMDGNSYLSEDLATGSFGRINTGNGSLGSVGSNTGDADAMYNIANVNNPNPGAPWGTAADLFPREANFQVGSLTYNEAGLTGVGVETRQILSLDLSAFWTSDPARTDFSTYGAPTVISDISDYALGLWFFNGPGAITFGGLNILDTVTFTDGVLTSIDLLVTTSFSASFGSALTWDGTFSISGNEVSYLINDTASSFLGTHTLVANLTGTVNAVPEPSVSLLVGLSLGGLLLRRKRNQAASGLSPVRQG